MTNHSGIQSLNNFVFIEGGEIIAWRAYNVGPGKVFSTASLARLGTRRTYKFTRRSVVLTC